MPPPRAPGLIIKKSGGQYSGAGDDDINDVAAMGGVNLSEEAQVKNRKLFADVRVEKYFVFAENRSRRQHWIDYQVLQRHGLLTKWSSQSENQ